MYSVPHHLQMGRIVNIPIINYGRDPASGRDLAKR
jgi:hypothetical protein